MKWVLINNQLAFSLVFADNSDNNIPGNSDTCHQNGLNSLRKDFRDIQNKE